MIPTFSIPKINLKLKEKRETIFLMHQLMKRRKAKIQQQAPSDDFDSPLMKVAISNELADLATLLPEISEEISYLWEDQTEEQKNAMLLYLRAFLKEQKTVPPFGLSWLKGKLGYYSGGRGILLWSDIPYFIVPAHLVDEFEEKIQADHPNYKIFSLKEYVR